MLDVKTRTYDYTPASFDAQAARELSGLAYMQALVAGEIGAAPSVGPTVGMTPPVRLAIGEADFEAEPGDYMLNPMGTVHGGFAATLLDSAMGVAVHTTLDPGMGFSTAELKVNYTRAILPGAGRLRIEGRIIHRGARMATAEGRVIGMADGKLYAHGSTTCFLFALPKAA